MIQNSLSLENVQMYGRGYVDLNNLWKELMTKWDLQAHYNNNNSILYLFIYLFTFYFFFTFFDLRKIWFIFSELDSKVYHGLSGLVKFTFGKPLNKIEQFSNWEQIPLRVDQINYAGM